MAFDKKQYDMNYMKLHKKQFKVDLNIEEYEELEKILQQKKISKVQFVRTSINKLKEEITNKEN